MCVRVQCLHHITRLIFMFIQTCFVCIIVLKKLELTEYVNKTKNHVREHLTDGVWNVVGYRGASVVRKN